MEDVSTEEIHGRDTTFSFSRAFDPLLGVLNLSGRLQRDKVGSWLSVLLVSFFFAYTAHGRQRSHSLSSVGIQSYTYRKAEKERRDCGRPSSGKVPVLYLYNRQKRVRFKFHSVSREPLPTALCFSFFPPFLSACSTEKKSRVSLSMIAVVHASTSG